MQRVISDAFTRRIDNSTIRYAWFIAMLGLCGDMRVINLLEPPRRLHPENFVIAVNDIARLIRNGRLSAIKDFNMVINHGLDDKLDSMTLDELLHAGEANLGNQPSAFIRNPKIASPDDWNRCMELVQSDVIPQDTLYSILNLMGYLIVQEARYKKEWIQTGKIDSLREAANVHLALNDVCFTTIMHFIQRDPSLDAKAREDDLRSVQDMSKAYPNSIHVARIVQIQDDLSDIVFDIMNELKSAETDGSKALPAANIFVARLCEKLQPPVESIVDFHKRLREMLGTLPTRSTISYVDLPKPIQGAINDVLEREYKPACQALPPVARTLAESAWRTTLQGGFPTGNNLSPAI